MYEIVLLTKIENASCLHVIITHVSHLFQNALIIQNSLCARQQFRGGEWNSKRFLFQFSKSRDKKHETENPLPITLPPNVWKNYTSTTLWPTLPANTLKPPAWVKFTFWISLLSRVERKENVIEIRSVFVRWKLKIKMVETKNNFFSPSPSQVRIRKHDLLKW